MKRFGVYATLPFVAAVAMTGATAGQASAGDNTGSDSPSGPVIVVNNYYGTIFSKGDGNIFNRGDGNTNSVQLGNTQSGTGNTLGGTQGGTNNTQGGTQGGGTGNTQGGTTGGTGNTQGGTQSGTHNTQGGTQSGTDNTQGGTQGTTGDDTATGIGTGPALSPAAVTFPAVDAAMLGVPRQGRSAPAPLLHLPFKYATDLWRM
ncbi:hypothetical protein [Streptomyces spiralis]|uniref:hypothetical protein n=1 Tax=Streptomyces spiralis TaxID=66376 RepID=UPI0034035505